jgi:hypothetical protein
VIGSQRSDDFIFAHLYDGAVKGFIALFEVLHAMRNSGFKREKIPLFNRKHSSLKNIQRMKIWIFNIFKA